MFNLQGSELIIILLLALVVLGPEKLPDAMRKMGQFYAELRKMSTGFQNEFKAAIDEPVREMRDTANTLRDSADFTKLQEGERAEKPKSGEMASTGDPVEAPTDDVPTFDTPAGTTELSSDGSPGLSGDSKSAPFADQGGADGASAAVGDGAAESATDGVADSEPAPPGDEAAGDEQQPSA